MVVNTRSSFALVSLSFAACNVSPTAPPSTGGVRHVDS